MFSFLHITRIFIAYHLIQIIWALIEFLNTKINIYWFIEALKFKFEKRCCDIFGNISVYTTFEGTPCCRVHLKKCKKIIYSQLSNYLPDFMYKH